jgi:choline transporter-like protein 2/4/5
MKSIKWLMAYHLGSIAFGALCIAICQMIRFLFEYYRKNIETWAGKNPVAKAILCITKYCLVCLEKCVKFLTKNAYI